MLPPISNRNANKISTIDTFDPVNTRTSFRRRIWGEETKKMIVIKDPIIHSIRKSNYFSADEKIAVVVICKRYD